jgi:hypothetical protein
MPLTMYDASVPVFRQMLSSLTTILDKAAAHAASRDVDPAVLLASRLYPDMLPLVSQVQIASDNAKGCSARLAGVDVPRYADTESSIDELKARLRKTIDFIETLQPAQFEGAETRQIKLQLGPQAMTFVGKAYLLHFVLPNFMFHVTTAYDILRHNGVELGKRDYIGRFDPD